MKRIIFCSILIIVLGCSKKDEPLSTNGLEGLLEIYFLEDSSITGAQATQMEINQYSLKNNPWLTNDDIQFYDFSSHCIYLKGDKSQFFENDTGRYLLFTPFRANRPFIVVANKERCYIGSFHSLMLSTAPRGPYMDELDIGYYPRDVMHISKGWNDTVDTRNDGRIKDVLISLGLYHGGISVDLKSVNIVENADTSTVEYVFRISNIDHDNLYVVDPNKMGIDLFHYFTNGIVFQGNGVLIQSMYKKVNTPSTSWDATWFTEIPINSSIERTVRLRGYPKLLPGKYRCYFTFSDPKVEKDNRYLTGGRIWLGSLVSSTIETEIY
jgi:hypothetical protein